MVSTKFSPALAILAGLLVWAVIHQLVAAPSWGYDSFPITEWLINYAGGFVRRGLPGSVIGILASVTGIQANHIAIAAGVVCYLVLGWWFLRRSTPVFPTALILSCIVMGFPAYQESIVRKDCFGLLLLLGCLSCEGIRLARPLGILLTNLLAGAAILSHEAFAFYALPALVVLRFHEREPLRGTEVCWRGVTLLPAVVCFCLVTVFHGTPAIANAVNASWMPMWRVIDPATPHLAAPAAAIQAIGLSSDEGLSPGINLLTSGWTQPTGWAILFALSFMLVILFTDRGADRGTLSAIESKVSVAAILVAQLVFISPLFLLGHDYGRWLFFWVASSLMLHTVGRRAPRWLELAIGRFFERAKVHQLLARLPITDWYLLFFGVPVCLNVYSLAVASPLTRHLRIIWMWL